MPPSYCTITGVAYRAVQDPSLTNATPTLAPSSRLHITPVSVTDNLIWEHTQTVQADPTTALITFNAVQGSTIHIQGSVMGWVAGDNVLVPSSATSTLEALTSVATVPTSGATVKDENVALASLIGTFNFAGAGVTATQSSAGVALITIPGAAGGSEFVEVADLAAGGTNTGRLYARDNGSGKTQLVVRFNTGAIQVIATEP